jgi:ABC-type Zn uptake system ZnuABC Zn-binding protein ZnuA
MSFVRAGLALAFALAVLSVGCGSSGDAEDRAVEVVATTTQVADLARAVGGERAAVHRILDANSDPHSYEPRPSDAAALAEADIVFRSGGEVDDWLDGLVESAGGDAPTVELGDAVELHEDDPHWWQDPRNAILAVAAIERALRRADPAGRARYRANARIYTRELRRLDATVSDCVGRIRPSRRKLVTTHDALGYYARRYGLEVVGALIPSLSTSAQPSAGDVEALVDQIREQDVQAIFPESSLAPRLERAVARETGAAVGERLWADSLGPEGSSGETYVDSIRSNTAAIVEGLTGGSVRCEPLA